MKKKVLIITLLPNKKLIDKIKPLTLALPRINFIVARRTQGPRLKQIEYISIKASLQNKPVIGSILLFFKILFKIKEINPCLIISYYFIPYGIMSVLFGLIFKIPSINSIIGSDQFFFDYKLTRNICTFLLNNSSGIVVTGSTSYNKFLEIIDKKSKLHLLKNTSNIKITDYDFKNRNIDFIFVGNFVPVKRIYLIIQSFGNLIQTLKTNSYNLPLLYLIGDGIEKPKIEKQIKDLNLEKYIILTGYQKNVNQFLKRSKFLLLASKNEGLPSVIIECLMNGCIPIVVDVGDITDIVNNSNGYLIRNSSSKKEHEIVKDLTDCMLKGINLKEEKFNEMSKLNIKESFNYDFSFGCKKWQEIFKKIFLRK